jgi:hypothetical protein
MGLPQRYFGTSVMSEELEPEILSYREFRKREALLAWQERRRAFEARVRRGCDFVTPPAGLRPRQRRSAGTGPQR